MNASMGQILDYLNRARIRCTYGAVAELLGVLPRSVGRLLSPRRPEASWVVNAATEEPTGYAEHEKHTDLYRTSAVIKTGEDLRRRMQRENRGRPAPGSRLVKAPPA